MALFSPPAVHSIHLTHVCVRKRQNNNNLHPTVVTSQQSEIYSIDREWSVQPQASQDEHLYSFIGMGVGG